MGVNAQSILKSIQKNAQKNIPTSKVKRAAVPDLSIFGITTAGGTGTIPVTPQPEIRTSLTTGANATVKPDKVTPMCEPQSSFLPRQEAAQGQVYLEQWQDEKVQEGAASKTDCDTPDEASCSVAITALMQKAVAIRKTMDMQSEVTRRIEKQEQSQFAAVFQPKQDYSHFVSHAELNRTEGRKGILRVAAYIRVSSDSEDQENSYETQDRYFTALLQKNEDWTSAGVYSDYGISGTNKENRTGYKRLLRHCKEGKIDRIVCKSISRFARNTSDFMAALDILHEHHVTILFEKENLDTEDPTSDFILTTLAAIAQEESRSISSNIRWGNQKRFPKGHTRNYEIYGYRYAEGEDCMETLDGGYQVRRVEVVEEEAEIVRYIFKAVEDGMPFVRIARELNVKHIPAPNQGKKPFPIRGRSTTKEGIESGWTSAMISRMISLERYCGDVLLQKNYTPDFLTHKTKRNKGEVPQYLVRDHHPAIIDRELFDSVQKIKEYNSRRFKNQKKERTLHAFSGRLTCAHCGRNYNVRNAELNPIWFCPTSALNNGKTVCRAEKVYEEQIVRMFRKAFIDRFELLTEPVMDDVTVADIMSGRYGQADIQCGFSKRSDDFVRQMMVRLENVQKSDHMERDRGFLKRQIDALQVTVTESGRRLRQLQTQKDTLETRKNLLEDASVTDAEIAMITNRLETELARQQEAVGEKTRLEQQLSNLEEYWAKVEYDHEECEKALEWMAGLPEGHEGTVAFLNGLTSTYVRAFALSITVYDPLHYTVHWFDDTRTEVEMYSNVEDYRNTSAYFDGQCMREKKYHK